MKHEMKIQNSINKISTLLNGENLIKPRFLLCSASLHEENSSIEMSIVEKGLNSLDNPVLRGSFTLVLAKEKLTFLDQIAKKAFLEVMPNELSKTTTASPFLRTIHLQTDPGRVQSGRPGVYIIHYIIQHREMGMCIIGQTKDLKKRFNQYTSRSKHNFLSTTNKINKNFYQAVQQSLKNFDYSQVFQRYVVYTWVDENGKALHIDKSLELQNEMSYLEHRLILAFFECGLAYNFQDVAPQLVKNIILEDNNGNVDTFPVRTSVQTGHQAKPFKIENLYFYCSGDYQTFRQSLDKNSRKKFFAMPILRKQLQNNDGNSKARYLTTQEIEEVLTKGLFYKSDLL